MIRGRFEASTSLPRARRPGGPSSSRASPRPGAAAPRPWTRPTSQTNRAGSRSPVTDSSCTSAQSSIESPSSSSWAKSDREFLVLVQLADGRERADPCRSRWPCRVRRAGRTVGGSRRPRSPPPRRCPRAASRATRRGRASSSLHACTLLARQVTWCVGSTPSRRAASRSTNSTPRRSAISTSSARRASALTALRRSSPSIVRSTGLAVHGARRDDALGGPPLDVAHEQRARSSPISVSVPESSRSLSTYLDFFFLPPPQAIW
jgi:hypothetical protein